MLKWLTKSLALLLVSCLFVESAQASAWVGPFGSSNLHNVSIAQWRLQEEAITAPPLEPKYSFDAQESSALQSALGREARAAIGHPAATNSSKPKREDGFTKWDFLIPTSIALAVTAIEAMVIAHIAKTDPYGAHLWVGSKSKFEVLLISFAMVLVPAFAWWFLRPLDRSMQRRMHAFFARHGWGVVPPSAGTNQGRYTALGDTYLSLRDYADVLGENPQIAQATNEFYASRLYSGSPGLRDEISQAEMEVAKAQSAVSKARELWDQAQVRAELNIDDFDLHQKEVLAKQQLELANDVLNEAAQRLNQLIGQPDAYFRGGAKVDWTHWGQDPTTGDIFDKQNPTIRARKNVQGTYDIYGGGLPLKPKQPLSEQEMNEVAGYLALAAAVNGTTYISKQRQEKVGEFYQHFREKYPPLTAAQLAYTTASYWSTYKLDDWLISPRPVDELVDRLTIGLAKVVEKQNVGLAAVAVEAADDFDMFKNYPGGHITVEERNLDKYIYGSGITEIKPLLLWAASFPNIEPHQVAAIYSNLTGEYHFKPKIAALLTVAAARHTVKEESSYSSSSSSSGDYMSNSLGLISSLLSLMNTMDRMNRGPSWRHQDARDHYSKLTQAGFDPDTAALAAIALGPRDFNSDREEMKTQFQVFLRQVQAENRKLTPPEAYFSGGEKVDWTRWAQDPILSAVIHDRNNTSVRARKNEHGTYDIYGGGLPKNPDQSGGSLHASSASLFSELSYLFQIYILLEVWSKSSPLKVETFFAQALEKPSIKNLLAAMHSPIKGQDLIYLITGFREAPKSQIAKFHDNIMAFRILLLNILDENENMTSNASVIKSIWQREMIASRKPYAIRLREVLKISSKASAKGKPIWTILGMLALAAGGLGTLGALALHGHGIGRPGTPATFLISTEWITTLASLLTGQGVRSFISSINWTALVSWHSVAGLVLGALLGLLAADAFIQNRIIQKEDPNDQYADLLAEHNRRAGDIAYGILLGVLAGAFIGYFPIQIVTILPAIFIAATILLRKHFYSNRKEEPPVGQPMIGEVDPAMDVDNIRLATYRLQGSPDSTLRRSRLYTSDVRTHTFKDLNGEDVELNLGYRGMVLDKYGKTFLYYDKHFKYYTHGQMHYGYGAILVNLHGVLGAKLDHKIATDVMTEQKLDDRYVPDMERDFCDARGIVRFLSNGEVNTLAAAGRPDEKSGNPGSKSLLLLIGAASAATLLGLALPPHAAADVIARHAPEVANASTNSKTLLTGLIVAFVALLSLNFWMYGFFGWILGLSERLTDREHAFMSYSILDSELANDAAGRPPATNDPILKRMQVLDRHLTRMYFFIDKLGWANITGSIHYDRSINYVIEREIAASDGKDLAEVGLNASDIKYLVTGLRKGARVSSSSYSSEINNVSRVFIRMEAFYRRGGLYAVSDFTLKDLAAPGSQELINRVKEVLGASQSSAGHPDKSSDKNTMHAWPSSNHVPPGYESRTVENRPDEGFLRNPAAHILGLNISADDKAPVGPGQGDALLRSPSVTDLEEIISGVLSATLKSEETIGDPGKTLDEWINLALSLHAGISRISPDDIRFILTNSKELSNVPATDFLWNMFAANNLLAYIYHQGKAPNEAYLAQHGLPRDILDPVLARLMKVLGMYRKTSEGNDQSVPNPGQRSLRSQA